MYQKIPIYVEGTLDKIFFTELTEIIQYKYFNNKRIFQVSIARNITQVLKKSLEVDMVCLGIIDDDKRKGKNYSKFTTCRKSEKNEYLYKNYSHRKYLIVMNKAIEDWLNYAAIRGYISRTDFDLPDNFDKFKATTKKQVLTNKDENNLKRYCKKIINTSPIAEELIKTILATYQYEKK